MQIMPHDRFGTLLTSASRSPSAIAELPVIIIVWTCVFSYLVGFEAVLLMQQDVLQHRQESERQFQQVSVVLHCNVLSLY